MNFQKLMLAGAVAIACGVASNAIALDLGGFKNPLAGGAASSGNLDNDIKAFLQTADEAHGLTSKSVLVLGQALLTKEEMQENDDKLAAANKITDDKEREAAKAKVEEELQAKLSKVNYEAKAAELAKENDKKKNAQVSASLYNFVLGMLKDKDLAVRGSSLMSSVAANPMQIGKVSKVKDVVASLSGQMGNMGKIATGLQKMSSTIKSAPLPTSASAAPISIAD